MASKDMVGLRMSSDEIARLDTEARKRGIKRAALIRTCINEALADPYKIIELASRGQFSAAQVRYMLSIEDGKGPVHRAIEVLRVWLIENPFHPDAEDRVKAAMSSAGHTISDRMKEDLKLLEKLEKSADLKNLLDTMFQEEAMRVFYKPEEDIENGD